MIVVGIDPGIERTGYAALSTEKGKQRLIDCGCIFTKKEEKQSMRLCYLYDGIGSVLKKNRPDAVALESLFFTSNARTAITVGQARGVILLSCGQKRIPVVTYAPLEVKLAVTGYGKADKNQVQQMVKSILGLKEIPRPDDAADAVAIALTHCFSYKRKMILT